MNYLSFILLLGQPAGGGPGQSNALVTFIPLLAVFVIFYFFMIRPQMKKQKELSNYRNSLKKGDKVITTGGIYGKIYEVKDNFVMLEVGGDLKLKVDKSALIADPTADKA
ncbi:MAG TPA: preprotein translocase subunit YajC [Bacteroidales bacterium]|nr:preprotein translocase subunit YajC [Bacteroidales bacterium]